MTSSFAYVIQYDPYIRFILCGVAIGWSTFGLLFLEELWDEAPSLGWKVFLLPFVGPAAWGVLLYRGLRSLPHDLVDLLFLLTH